MNSETRRLSRRPIVFIACVGVCVGVVVAGVFALVGAGGEEPALTAADLDEMGQLVRLWEEAKYAPWPKDAYARTTFTKAEAAAVQQAYLDVVRRVGTEEFQKHPMGNYDVASFLEGYRQSSPPQVPLKYECTVLDTDFVRYDRGDAIIHVKVWVGEVVGELGQRSTRVVRVTRYDWAPVWEARMRDTGEGWKIVGLRTRWSSEDLDPEQYGPDTPHSMEYVPVEWSGEP